MLPLDHTFDHHGQSVAWGKIGNGPPMVLVHGFPWSAQAWRRVAPWLAQHHTVYYFDMIGTGQSQKVDGQDVSPPVQSDLLAALIAHWGLEAPHIVGHDFGGLCALRGVFLLGVPVGRLTLMNAVGVLPSGSPFYAHVRHHEAAFAGLPDYAHAALFKAYIANAAHHPMRADAEALYLDPWSGPIGQPAFYRQIAQSGEAYIAEAMERYRKLDVPTHVIWAVEDTFIPLAQGQDLAERIGADRFTPIEGAGHVVQEDAPEAVVGAILGNA